MERQEFLAQCVFVDLEVDAKLRLRHLGAVCGNEEYEQAGRGLDAQRSLRNLDDFVRKRHARYVAGHNLLQHDWPVIRQIVPRLPLLRLPVVDTLFLSPLAFPQNPYHALVKDYKLVRTALNDPVADARLSARLFCDEWDAFANTQESQRGEALSLLRFCFGQDVDSPEGRVNTAGIVQFFDHTGAQDIDADRAMEIFVRHHAERACRTALTELAAHPPAGRERIALAYAAAWLPVAGGNSVLPPWVRLAFPEVVTLIQRLREQPCKDSDCEYCHRVHNPDGRLKRYFGFDSFREEPRHEDGTSLQRAIVRRGMGNQPLLAILPTGGGKSLCYQLPAIVRNYRRGVLTIVISPLQALMKDQVDNFAAKTSSGSAAALSGMLTPPERGQVLEQVRKGDVGLLYISPEQLRNKSTIDAIQQREIGCWVFDEAHCLSKWGHDFRPDYLYAARFIRQLAERQRRDTPPPVACFTATAKQDVMEEIVEHFRNELGQHLEVFHGGIERKNLKFEVQTTGDAEKFARIHELLAERLDDTGCAVVYTATRKTSERLAEYLERQGWDAQAFHAGLKPSEKREIQDQFVGGQLRVICATNAFGMGIDKDDVRMVVHADMPGSLENYLQEAGRAGRDHQPAQCVLLYGEEDVETQFALSAISQLTPRDIAQILRGLRRAKRRSEVLVITSGELLRDEDVDTSFDSDETMADTKVKTAVAWLERAGFLERNHNATFVFQGKPQVQSVEETEERVASMALTPIEKRQWLEILSALMNADGPEGISADRLAELPSFRETTGQTATRGMETQTDTQRVLRTLEKMADKGLVQKGILLSAYVRHKVADGSRDRLKKAERVESALLEVMQEQEPDAAGGGWLTLSLRRLNQALVDRGSDSSPDMIRNLLTSLSMDGRGFAGKQSSLDFRHSHGDVYRVNLHRDWSTLIKTSELRKNVAAVVLDTILGKVPKDAAASADLLVEFSCEDLTQAVRADLVLRDEIKDAVAAVDRGLMYLHEQRAIVLQHGLSVFRQAMTIRLKPESRRRRYTKGDFEPLDRHYEERILQVHVMCEYARRGLESMKDGLNLVLAYFSDLRSDFVDTYFGDRKEIVQRAITHEAYQRIVDELHNPVQQAVVAAPEGDNQLILAGPGSGKTRAVVHRVAYLVRVQRVRPQSILVLCFNRLAAVQLKQRLRELVGKAGARVTVLTYHALAMRMTGSSFAERAGGEGDNSIDFSGLIPAATRILRGEQPVAGLPEDEVRDRLLAGYHYVLVDEYQDIDAEQYDLISALTGRTIGESDHKLSILAVGDDDQNIYSFRGANVEHIRRFRSDYQAHIHYLLDNYRSTANIIAAANQLIALNSDRMKTEHPIRINADRKKEPPGGEWQLLDHVGRGRVQILEIADGQEAVAITAELQRLQQVEPKLDWSTCAVLARTRESLHMIRAACEHLNIPVTWGLDGDRSSRLHRVREIAEFLDHLHAIHNEDRTATRLTAIASGQATDGNPWRHVLLAVLEEWRDETGDAKVPVAAFIESLYESLAEQRREQRVGHGVFMNTVHAAKGTEFDHVVVPATGWTHQHDQTSREEERRLYYVAMTRAKQTLTLCTMPGTPSPHASQLTGDCVLHRPAASTESIPSNVLARRYELLGLDDIDVGFAGSKPEHHPIHAGLAELQPGSLLKARVSVKGRVELVVDSGLCVARLSASGSSRWCDKIENTREVRVVAVLRRNKTDEQPEYRDRSRCEQWQVPVVEFVLE